MESETETRPKVTQASIIKAMTESAGDRELAAGILGIPPKDLRAYFAQYPDLASLYVEHPSKPNAVPDGIKDAIVRQNPRNLPPAAAFDAAGKELVDALKKQDAIFYNADALKRIGLKEKTIQRIMSMGDFNTFAGRHMYCSLEMSQRILALNLPVLFEMAEEYREQYLKIKEGDPTVTGEELRETYKVYLAMLDTFRSYHKTLFDAAAVMAQITGGGKGGQSEPPKARKLKFSPLIDGEVVEIKPGKGKNAADK